MLLARIWSSLESQAWLTRKTLPAREAFHGPKSLHGPPRGRELLLGAGIFHAAQRAHSLRWVLHPPTPQTPLLTPHPTHQQAVILGEGDSVADLGGPLVHMAWKQRLLSVSLKGVDSRGLRGLGEGSRESDVAEIRPQRPVLITKGPPAEESSTAACFTKEMPSFTEGQSWPLCGAEALRLCVGLPEKIEDAQLNLKFRFTTSGT